MKLPVVIKDRLIQRNFDAIVAALGGNRIVAGIVLGNGTIFSGSNFTAARASAGVYNITFNKPFGNIPAVTATPNAGGGELAALSNRTVTGVTVTTTTRAAGTVLDTSFDFQAIGL